MERNENPYQKGNDNLPQTWKKFKNTHLNNSWMTEGIRSKLWKYLELKDTENTTCHRLWDSAVDCSSVCSPQGGRGVGFPCALGFYLGPSTFIFQLLYVHLWTRT